MRWLRRRVLAAFAILILFVGVAIWLGTGNPGPVQRPAIIGNPPGGIYLLGGPSLGISGPAILLGFGLLSLVVVRRLGRRRRPI